MSWEEEVDWIDNAHISETILWEMRDKIDPPHFGYTMFASSCLDENVPFLLSRGYDLEDITVMVIAGNETVWYKKKEEAQ